jgi:hypothetical protein
LQTKGSTKGRRGSTFAGEELCMDVLINSSPVTFKLAKNHNLVYEIDGEYIGKTAL